MSGDVGGHPSPEDPDALLSPLADPGGIAFDPLGTGGGDGLNWFALVRRRVQHRTVHSRHYRWWVLWSLLAGLLALNFTFTVFIVALPSVAHQLHTSITVLTWTMVGPLLAYGLAAPILGRAGDVIGHRRLYLIGLASAIVTAVLTALSVGAGMLLVARALDGIQGAATGTASGALINLVFDREERVKAMGWWSVVGAGGPVIGVSLGSPIIQAWGWRALFWVQTGLIAAALIVVVVVLPNRRVDREREVEQRNLARANFRATDWVGSWALSLSVTAVMLGLSLGPIFGWTSAGTLATFVASAAGVALFVHRVRTAAHPIIPPEYFHRRNFTWPMVLRACNNFAYFGGFFLFPLLMEEGYGYSIAAVGGIAVIRPIVNALSSPASGYSTMRVGERPMAVLGSIAMLASMILFAVCGPTSSIWLIGLALALSGAGQGVTGAPTGSVMAGEVHRREFGVMSAAQLLAMQVGEVAGIQVMETIQQGDQRREGLAHAVPGHALLESFHLPFWIGAGVAGVGVVAASALRSIPRERRRANASVG